MIPVESSDLEITEAQKLEITAASYEALKKKKKKKDATDKICSAKETANTRYRYAHFVALQDP